MSLASYRWIVLLLVGFAGCGKINRDIQQADTAKAQTSDQDSLSTAEDKLLRPKPLPANRISIYDPIIKKYSRRFGFDWRLIAAQIYAESRFIVDAKSHVGALGLMQIMPRTARHMGLDPNLLLKPEQNISIGCLYDRKLYDRWKDKTGSDRLAFTLASFNAGRTRVLQLSTRANSPRTWQDVKPHLPRETRNYVTKIFNKYEIYKSRYF